MTAQLVMPPSGARFLPERIEVNEGATRAISMDISARIGSSTISGTPTLVSDPSGLTFTTPVVSGGTITARVSGGSARSNYHAKLTANLSNGEVEVAAFQIRFKEPTDTDSAGA